MISNNKVAVEANKQVKINAKGKFLGTVMGDYSGAPAESYTWGESPTRNKNITKNNLKMCPLFKNEEKDYKYVVPHPLYSKDNTELKDFIQYCSGNHMHVTDDTFFSGEGVNAGLQNFCSENANKIDINDKCRQFYNQYTTNLRQFENHKINGLKVNEQIVGECGPGTQAFLRGGKTDGSIDRDGSVMRIGQVALFADSLPDLNKIVLATVRNTHYHQYSFDAARSVASVVYMTCCGLSQKSIANYIAFEFARRYTKKPPIIYKDRKNEKPSDYFNGDKFFNFKMYDTVREVYKDRTDYNYTETALDNVVPALRIICVAGSFLEAWRLTKAYAADSDTLQAIVLSMAAFMFGIPEEFQEEARKVLRNHESPDIKGYEKTSDELDNKCSNLYRENAPLEEQLKKTLGILKDIEKNKSRNMVDINNEIGFKDGKEPFHNYETVKEENLKVDCPEFKNLIKSICDDWNFNLSLDDHYNQNRRKLFEYEPGEKLPKNAPKDVLEKYRAAEIEFYNEVNQHNLATAEFQDKIKMDKLKALTPEKREEINKLIDEINQIAKKYEVKAEIKKLPPRDLQPCRQTILSIEKAESGQQTVNLSQAEAETDKKEPQTVTDESSNLPQNNNEIGSKETESGQQTVPKTVTNTLPNTEAKTNENEQETKAITDESQNRINQFKTLQVFRPFDLTIKEMPKIGMHGVTITEYTPDVVPKQKQESDTTPRSPYKYYFWYNKRKTAILVFVFAPAVLVVIAFCLLSFGTGAAVSGGVVLVDLLAFYVTSKLYNYPSEPTNAIVSQVDEPEPAASEVSKEKNKKIEYNADKLSVVSIKPKVKDKDACKDANK